jgi:hypothetical protein
MKMPSPKWVGNPGEHPVDTVVLCDILGVGTNSTPGNSTNSITYTLGCAYSGDVFSANAMQINSPGIVSIPVGPGEVGSDGSIDLSNTSQTAAQALAYVRNDQWTVIGTRDTRTQDRPGNAQPGDTVVYSQLGQGRVLCKGNGSVSLYTTNDNTSSGTGMFFSVSPNGSITGGPAFIMQADFGRFIFDATGVHFITATGATFDLGGMSAPGPLAAAFGTYCNIGAANINLNASTTTSCALAGAPLSDAVVLSTPFCAELIVLLNTLIGALISGVTAEGGLAVTFPGAVAALAAMSAALAPNGVFQKAVASSSLQGAYVV